MTSRYQICCVTRSEFLNHHQRLRQVGGVNRDGSWWKISEAAAIEGIEEGRWQFFVADAGRRWDVVVATSKYGRKYIKTEVDGLQPENLLRLPECR
ncbi:MAG TPA: DUF3892 domain-containing protein [Stellaceae bacterium]|nr:DUF3892 domain-containing protein [Stellaceae bacterium]